MKKFYLLLVLLAFSTGSFAAEKQWFTIPGWDALVGAFKDEFKPVAYTLDTSGDDLRVYTWEDPVIPGWFCSGMASSKSTTHQCVLISDVKQIESIRKRMKEIIDD